MSIFQWLSTYIWTDPNIMNDPFPDGGDVMSDDSSDDSSPDDSSFEGEYKDGEYKFMLCKNNKVLGYTDSVDDIPKIIRKCVLEDKSKFGTSYVYSVIDKHPGILLTGREKNSLFSYDRVLSRYSFSVVRKL